MKKYILSFLVFSLSCDISSSKPINNPDPVLSIDNQDYDELIEIHRWLKTYIAGNPIYSEIFHQPFDGRDYVSCRYSKDSYYRQIEFYLAEYYAVLAH